MLENTVGKTWANTFLRVAVTLLVMGLKYGKKYRNYLTVWLLPFIYDLWKKNYTVLRKKGFFFSQPELFLSKCGGENRLTLNSQGTGIKFTNFTTQKLYREDTPVQVFSFKLLYLFFQNSYFAEHFQTTVFEQRQILNT